MFFSIGWNNDKFKVKEVIKMPTFKEVNIDGVVYEGDPVLVDAYVKRRDDASEYSKKLEKLEETLKVSQENLDKTTAQRDTFNAELEKLKTENETLKNIDHSEEVNKQVKERLRILDAARNVKVEIDENQPNTELKKAIILKVYPHVDLADKNGLYIDAFFDAALETQKSENNDTATEVFQGQGNVNGNSSHVDSRKNREKMIERTYKKSRGEEDK